MDAVKILPGDTFPNGYSRTFDVDGYADDSLEINVPVVAINGTVDFGAHVVFKDASGVTLKTVTRVATLDGAHELGVRTTIPVDAVTAQVSHGAINGSTPTAAAVVGWVPGVPRYPTHRVNTGPFPTTCQAWSGTCECNISCPKGYVLKEVCIETPAPACTRNAQCYCAPEEGAAEFLGSDGWL